MTFLSKLQLKYPDALLNQSSAVDNRLRADYVRKTLAVGLCVPVLDHGSVKLEDFMGDDLAICEAAWTSTEGAVTNKSPVPQFLDYLKRHKHSGPFEFAMLKFKIKAPLFVARQWMRHRTSAYNEQSGRYVELADEFYFPEDNWRAGGTGHNGNKQGSEALLDEELQLSANIIYKHLEEQARDSYKQLLAIGVAPELARLSVTTAQYTEFVWTVNLHNLMHFLQLRTDSHAQKEMQEYANVVMEITKLLFPEAMRAWENHQKDAVTFSQDEQAVLAELIQRALTYDTAGSTYPDAETESLTETVRGSSLRKSRQTELLEKLNRVLGNSK